MAVAMALATVAGSCDQQTLDGPVGTPPDGANIEEAPETLSLALEASAGDVVTVDLVYARRAEQAAPRMMELWVSYDGLTYLGAESGAAVERAGKRLVVQEQPGELRLVVYAADNLAVVESGPVARLSFRRGGSDGSVALQARDPFFAPAAANDGVLLGPALRVPAEVTP